MIIALTAGTALIMWFGELITDRGVGNGMSLLIFVSIISTMPGQFLRISQQTEGPSSAVVCAVGLVVIAAVVYVEQAQRRIPVQYAKRMVGSRNVRRRLDLHPAKGQHGRCYPGHLSRHRCSTSRS